MPLGKAGLAVIVAAMAAGASHTVAAHAGAHHHGSPARSAVAAQAISYARAQLGRPYCWGGTGATCPNPPYTGYDCSGLVMEAYASAGITIPRTTFAQWADLPHVPASQAEPGDLVLGVGSDGTWANPGHVGLLLPGGRVEQAFATGWPINIVSLSNFGAAAGGIVGYARPGGA
jgi:cell wall-associated NlpC family hydrolase